MNFNDLNWQPSISYNEPNSEALKMTREEAIRELKQWRVQMKSHGVPDYGKKLISLDLAIEALQESTTKKEALEQEPSEDCISREYMLEKAQEWKNMYPDSDTAREALTMLMNEIDNAPSVAPKKRTGKPDFADCEKCSKIYGTLGCCSTVSNEWVYSCLEGMTDYAYTRGYKDGAEQSNRQVALTITVRTAV